MRKATNILLLFALFASCACGMKGPVRPLEEKLPGTVKEVKLHQRGAGFLLQWKMPDKNLDGTPLDNLDQVYVEHLLISDADFCAECSAPWPLLTRVSPQLPRPAQRINDAYLLSDGDFAPGDRIHYRLRVRSRQGDFGPELEIAQSVRPAVEPPAELGVSGQDRSADLRWREAEVPAGARLLGYQVYRRVDDEPYSLLPTNLLPLQKPSFSDFGIENGRLYHYRVRSLFDFGGEQVESLPSCEVSTIPAAG